MYILAVHDNEMVVFLINFALSFPPSHVRPAVINAPL